MASTVTVCFLCLPVCCTSLWKMRTGTYLRVSELCTWGLITWVQYTNSWWWILNWVRCCECNMNTNSNNLGPVSTGIQDWGLRQYLQHKNWCNETEVRFLYIFNNLFFFQVNNTDLLLLCWQWQLNLSSCEQGLKSIKVMTLFDLK